MVTSPSVAAPAAETTDHGLLRVIGLWPAVMLVVGNVIGSAIFLTPGAIAEALPSVPLVLAAWLAGGLLACAGGLTFAEMGTMFPRSGGLYTYLAEAFGPFVAFLCGWAMVLVVLPGGVAAVAVAFAESFSYFAPALGTDRILLTVPWPAGEWPISAGQIVAVVFILASTAVNLFGVGTASLISAGITVLKIAAVAAIPLVAVVVWPQTPALVPVAAPVPRPWAAFGVAMVAVMWAFEGWSYLAFAAGEVKRPERTLPRALVFGSLGLTVLYVLANAGYFIALPLEAIAGEDRVAEKAMRALVGPAGATVVAATVCVSTLGCNLAGILTMSRAGFAMAVDGLFFRFAARVHPVWRTPHGALVGLGVWSSVLALSGSYEQLFTYATFAAVLFNLLGGFAIFRLRRTHAGVPRPYRAWGYPVVPLLFILGSLVLVANTLVERPFESIAGLGLVLLGAGPYCFWQRRRASAASHV